MQNGQDLNGVRMAAVYDTIVLKQQFPHLRIVGLTDFAPDFRKKLKLVNCGDDFFDKTGRVKL
jgi:hypothetical protein